MQWTEPWLLRPESIAQCRGGQFRAGGETDSEQIVADSEPIRKRLSVRSERELRSSSPHLFRRDSEERLRFVSALVVR